MPKKKPDYLETINELFHKQAPITYTSNVNHNNQINDYQKSYCQIKYTINAYRAGIYAGGQSMHLIHL